MAASEITGLTELEAAPADDDELVIVDVSDTTQSANGSTKRLAASRVARTGAANTFTTAQVFGSGATGGQVAIKAGDASTVGLVVDTAASPSANALEIRNNGASGLAITADGTVSIGSHGGYAATDATTVTTTATQIAAPGSRMSLIMVYGKSGAIYFCDLILNMTFAGNAPTVIDSKTFGAAPTRTYSENNGAVKLALSSGSYDVQTMRIARLGDPV